MEKYSVLMALYIKEKPEFFDLALKSMINQTIKPNEIIIVKDGPITKELENVIVRYKNNYKNLIKIFGYNKNKGLATALNFGLEKCNNDLVARMDTDDYSLPERCEKQLKEFEKNKNLSLLGTSTQHFVNDPFKASNVYGIQPVGLENIKKQIKKGSAFSHPTVMFRKSSVLQCGAYDTKLIRSQDHDLFSRMVYREYDVNNLEEPLVLFRADSDCKVRNRSKDSCKARIEIQKRLLKRKQCNWLDYIYIYISTKIARILPEKIYILIYSLIKEKSRKE